MFGVRFSDTPSLAMGTELTLERFGRIALGPSIELEDDDEVLIEEFMGTKDYTVFFDIQTDTYVFGEAAPREAFEFIGHISYEVEEADNSPRRERYEDSVSIHPKSGRLSWSSPDIFLSRGVDPITDDVYIVYIPEIMTFLMKPAREVEQAPL